MRNIKWTSVALAFAGLASTAAQAADLPVKAAREVERQPVANWTGFYVGLGGGYGLFDARQSITALTPPPALTSGNQDVGGRGGFGRVQIGYDYQFGGNWLLGVLADYDFSSIKGNIADPFTGGLTPIKQTSAWAAGGRIGYLFTPQILTFFDGGYAESRFRGGTEVGGPFFPGTTGISIPKQNYTGYFLGGGTEIMVMPGWFVKSEYRLASYDAKTVNLTVAPPAGPGTGTFTSKPIVQTISAELVYKFNWGR